MASAAGTAPSLQIGPYRLLRRVGQGGMGEVWLAEQLQPVRRQVALKVIKAGMDTRAVIARFEAERQALALMNHPNIAGVFDAGATPEGRPYFAMEYVQGIPITDYCDKQRLSIRERLTLVRRGLRRRAARASEGDHPPRHQAVERARDDARTRSTRRRSSTSASPRPPRSGSPSTRSSPSSGSSSARRST